MRGLKISPTIIDRDSRSLKSYFHDLSPIKVLTPNEEYELAVKAFNGDEKSKEELIKHNLKFVISVAKQYQRFGLRLEDLINEGNIGLVGAANRFDPSRGFKFISYAVWWIRSTILKYIQDNGKTVRQPVSKILVTFKIKKRYTLLEQKLERSPSYIELFDELINDFTEEDIDYFINNLNEPNKSLDAPLTNDVESITLLDVIAIDSNKTNHLVNSNDSEIRTDAILKRLNDFEKKVIILSYGLNGDEILSLKEIADLLGTTVSKISLTKDKSLRKLKFKLLKEGRWVKEN